jgi:hypothetical protein
LIGIEWDEIRDKIEKSSKNREQKEKELETNYKKLNDQGQACEKALSHSSNKHGFLLDPLMAFLGSIGTIMVSSLS